jgi:hypothetical protein
VCEILKEAIKKNNEQLELTPINVFLFSKEMDNKENPVNEEKKIGMIVEAINVSNKFHFANRFLNRKGPKIFVRQFLLNDKISNSNCKISFFSCNVWLRRWLVSELQCGLTKYTSVIFFHYLLLSRDNEWCSKMINYIFGDFIFLISYF